VEGGVFAFQDEVYQGYDFGGVVDEVPVEGAAVRRVNGAEFGKVEGIRVVVRCRIIVVDTGVFSKIEEKILECCRLRRDAHVGAPDHRLVANFWFHILRVLFFFYQLVHVLPKIVRCEGARTELGADSNNRVSVTEFPFNLPPAPVGGACAGVLSTASISVSRAVDWFGNCFQSSSVGRSIRLICEDATDRAVVVGVPSTGVSSPPNRVPITNCVWTLNAGPGVPPLVEYCYHHKAVWDAYLPGWRQ